MENMQYPGPKQEYKVLVRCYTFNHSKYIEDALKGFAMQQTNFPFICLVIDDASVDGEPEVIKQWIGRECDMDKAETIDIPTSIVIIVPHKTNPSCTFAFYLLKQNLHGKKDKKKHVNPWREKCEYEALCEGDDYWIDPLKLQKQVDFLDNNCEFTISYTNANIRNEDKNNVVRRHFKGISGNITQFLLTKGNPIVTASVCLRTSVLEQYINDRRKYNLQLKTGDLPLWIYASYKGKVHYLPDSTVVYRVLPNSASHIADPEKMIAFTSNAADIRLYMNKHYNLGAKEEDIYYLHYCMLIKCISGFSFKDFQYYLKKYVSEYPKVLLNIRAWLYIFKALLKK